MRSKVLISLFIVFAMITSAMIPLSIYDNGNVSAADVPVGNGTPGDPFLVRDADELSKVGKGMANIETEYQVWTLDKSYRLASDIVFGDDDDKNGGIQIGIVVTYNESRDELSIVLTPNTGNITSLYVWIGEKNSVSVSPSNEVTVEVPDNPGTYTMAVGGTHTGEGGTFAYAIEIDTTSPNNGTVATDTFNSNGNFDPIGDATEPFTGTFDGAGFKISGMNIAVFSSSNVDIGMFGYIDGASITNLGVTDGYSVLTTTSTYSCIGSIVGIISENSIFTDCYNTGNVTAAASITSGSGTVRAGGIIGETESFISNCYNTGNVTAMSTDSANAGGITWYSVDIEKCYNTGNVFAASSAPTPSTSPLTTALAAGMTCEAESGIKDCYNIGNVTAMSTGQYTRTYAGGIASASYRAISDIENCYNIGNVKVASISTDSGAGGIIAHMGSASIMNSYFLNGTAPDLFVSGNPYDTTDSGPRSAEWMKAMENYPWDFDNVWGISPELNGGFPVLETFVFFLILEFEGYGNVTGPVIIYGGSTVTVTIIPDGGNKIRSVTDNGNDVTALVSNNEYDITNISGDRTVKVVFGSIVGPDVNGNSCGLIILIVIMTTVVCSAYFFALKDRDDDEEE